MDPELRKKLLLALALFGGLLYLAYNYVYSPRAAEVVTLEQRLETLETKNRVARTLIESDGREGAERRLARYREQLERVEGLIPLSEEVPDLLDAISAQARRTGVELSLIQPVGAVAETFYTRRTYDLGVKGSYHQIAEFLTQIGSLPRIITPMNLSVTVAGDAGADEGSPVLNARFTIETYVLPAPSREPQPSNDA